jgi:bacterial/archaeal transporter family protein
MLEWLAPALGFALLEGALGITTKLAFRGIDWRQLLLWVTAAYVLLAAGLVVIGGYALPLGAGAGWAALSGLFAAGGLWVFFVALGRGEASRVVPVTAAYPVATVILAAIFLSEEIDAPRVAGTVLVVAGVTILSRD